ncbi:MAG TPA: BACON domain-containing carbohydrate-binding protein [Bryobacteraceae bacterium]|nr:BACON domain-containing carbohydrate-binding protein [Bryobacteraceae bacterium]
MQARSVTGILFVLAPLVTLLPRTAGAQTVALSYRPVAAEYSTSLDRIVLVSANPNQLHIYNPATRSDFPINLSKAPLSLSISPDGMHAAVGHDGSISYVSIATQSLEKMLVSPTTVTSLALGSAYVYVPNAGSIQISTGALNGSLGVPGSTSFRLHPSGAGLYTIPPGSPAQLIDIDVTTGPMGTASAGPYAGDYPVCGGLWFSPDGRRVYTGCATVFQANPSVTGANEFTWSRLDVRQDGLYWTILSGTRLIRNLSESSAISRMALIPAPDASANPGIADNQVLLYDTTFLEPAGTLQLPGFTSGAVSYPSHAQQLFFNSTGSALYVLMQADSSAGLQNDFALQIIPIGNPSACAPAFSLPSAAAPATGTIGTAAIVAPATCIYQASSDSSWLQIVSGGYGSGNGVLTYVARPNTGLARTGNITVGTQTFAVTQPGPLVNGVFNPLSYSVSSTDYSKVLDKLILIASNLNELHEYDPTTGSDLAVALPKLPLSVSVSRDGLTAMVGMDGWISIVNLSTGAVASTMQVYTDVHSVLSGSNGFVYALPQREQANLFSIETATGNITAANASGDGRIPRLSASGNYFYLDFSKWDITQGAAKLVLPQPGFANIAICNGFWLAEDGSRMFTACGTSYTASDTTSADLLPDGRFANAPLVQWAAESAKLHSTAVLAAVWAGITSEDTTIQMYGDATLGYSGSLALPSFTVGTTPYTGHGRFAYWSKNTDRLIVVQQADASAGLVADYGVTTYPLNTPSAGCTFTLSSNSTTLSLTGGSTSVNVSTGSSCIWKATSNATWITVTAGAVAFASSTLTFSVSPNNTNVTRVGTLTVAGQTFTVTEAGNPPGLNVTKTHTGNFTPGQTGATYTISISSVSGAPLSGTVTVTDNLPAGLSAVSIAGAGWTCTQASFSCSRTDIIAPGSSYSPVTVTVNVAANAPSSITNTAVVSGANLPVPITVTDVTTIQGN